VVASEQCKRLDLSQPKCFSELTNVNKQPLACAPY